MIPINKMIVRLICIYCLCFGMTIAKLYTATKADPTFEVTFHKGMDMFKFDVDVPNGKELQLIFGTDFEN